MEVVGDDESSGAFSPQGVREGAEGAIEVIVAVDVAEKNIRWMGAFVCPYCTPVLVDLAISM